MNDRKLDREKRDEGNAVRIASNGLGEKPGHQQTSRHGSVVLVCCFSEEKAQGKLCASFVNLGASGVRIDPKINVLYLYSVLSRAPNGFTTKCRHTVELE